MKEQISPSPDKENSPETSAGKYIFHIMKRVKFDPCLENNKELLLF